MLKETSLSVKQQCFHCGDDADNPSYRIAEKNFCCAGCKTVYEILNRHNMGSYYAYNDVPGKSQKESKQNLDYLDVKEIAAGLIDYQDESISIITLYIPAVHCSSCIWLLENIHELEPAVIRSRIDFLKKQVNITFKTEGTTLRKIAELLGSVGYEPLISLQDMVREKQAAPADRGLITRIAVAGFCFGNVMLLSFPDYFGLGTFERSYADFFGWLNLAFCIPVVWYSGTGYFVSAWNNLKAKRLNLDFPLALGIAVMFIRSVYEIVLHTGAGFADTLCGLVFFLLVGKWMQQRTFHHISFERDYRSYFPVAVTTIDKNKEKPIPLSELKTGDRILVRSMEIIPADAILLKGGAEIDFSFVTGEARPVKKVLGEVIYAGGRQLSGAIEMEVLKPVSQSYLTQLWNNDAFLKPRARIRTFSDTASKYFSVVLLLLAFGAAAFWIASGDPQRALASFTAVLIIACPCALALSSPFTLAAAISIFDKNGLYLKNNAVVEEMARIDTLVFDKTGTITSPDAALLSFSGHITDAQKQLVSDLAVNSGHPLSRELVRNLNLSVRYGTDRYTEKIGRGISGMVNGNHVKLGSSAFLGLPLNSSPQSSSIHVMINDEYLGSFSLRQQWRNGFKSVVQKLSRFMGIHLLSGDRDHDKAALIPFFASSSHLHFGQSPQDKLDYILNLQKQGKKVLMFGDGLNDSGALKQSDLGIAVTDNINNFSPGCDAVLDGKNFDRIPLFIRQAKDAVRVIHLSFGISLSYNLLGLSFAVQGLLSPLIAAILMPLSTVTIISFTTVAVRVLGRKNNLL